MVGVFSDMHFDHLLTHWQGCWSLVQEPHLLNCAMCPQEKSVDTEQQRLKRKQHLNIHIGQERMNPSVAI